MDWLVRNAKSLFVGEVISCVGMAKIGGQFAKNVLKKAREIEKWNLIQKERSDFDTDISTLS